MVFRGSFLFLFLSILSIGAWAQERALATRTYGIEVELDHRNLNTFIGMIDFQKIEEQFLSSGESLKSQLTDDHLKNYLRNSSEAFKTLPKDLKDRLTEGLTLDRRIIETSNQGIINPNNGLILGKGIEVSSTSASTERPSFQLPSRSIENQPIDDQLLTTRSSGLAVPNTTDWEEVYKRWDKLSLEDKLKAVNFNLIPASAKKDLYQSVLFGKSEEEFMKLPLSNGPQDGAYIKFAHKYAEGTEYTIPLTIDPESKLATTLKRMNFHRDQKVTEFIHIEPVEDISIFKQDVKNLGTLGGISSFLDNPQEMLNTRGDSVRKFGSVHIHIGNKNLELGKGKYSDALVEAFRVHFLLKMAENNRIIYQDRYGSLVNNEGKGIEFRDVPENFNKFVDDIDEIMQSNTAEEAHKTINKQIAELSTKENLQRVSAGGFNYREYVRNYLEAKKLIDFDINSLPVEELNIESRGAISSSHLYAKDFTSFAIKNVSDEQLRDPKFMSELFGNEPKFFLHLLDERDPIQREMIAKKMEIMLENPGVHKMLTRNSDVARTIAKSFPASEGSNEIRNFFDIVYNPKRKISLDEFGDFFRKGMSDENVSPRYVASLLNRNIKLRPKDRLRVIMEILKDEKVSYSTKNNIVDYLGNSKNLLKKRMISPEDLSVLKSIVMDDSYRSFVRKSLLDQLSVTSLLSSSDIDELLNAKDLKVNVFEKRHYQDLVRRSRSCLRRMLPF